MSRHKIVQAAIELFALKGYHQASMDEIAIRAGVAKGSLYYHFTGKSQLFQTIVSEGLRQITTRIDAELNSSASIHEQIQNIVGYYVDLFLEYSDLAHIVFHELSNGIEEEVLMEIRQLRNNHLTYMAGILAEGVKLGYIRDIDCRLAASGVFGMLDGCCDYFLRNNSQVTRQQVKSFISSTVLSGIVTKNV
ncbi:TetR/AcrR family transcriptional regulator [Paenibacillus ginsengarvi]|uniref:TetR/AcrR family transcriptional regulator n=1 Tax=Paenibacillus ginsengarvi TaxID=400777 RepID=A0A3B0C6V6_9BACL|nr:TetR/AcrR family transcriptional regulator [Paenibacillus ginsengarvi]RKN80428.1 TetR/AcrR family transcriptional regulator [Paenibacillus ginsengarvi]